MIRLSGRPLRYASLMIVAIGMILAASVRPCSAWSPFGASCYDECGPGTLFQWSYGNSFRGGPDPTQPITTDRPDFTESSVTVGRGVTQFEMDYTYVNDRSPGSSFDGHSFPTLLVRQGMLADWFELRLAWTWLSETETVGAVKTTNSRSSDLLVGCKLALTPQEGILPEMALMPQMLLPVSSDPVLGGGEVLPGLTWIYSWELTERLSTAGQSQLFGAIDDTTGASYGLFAQSWVFGYSITERLGAYGEWFMLTPDGADTVRTQHYLNGGFTYLLTDNIQLDVRAGVGLNDAADDYFLGPGLSVRFP